MTNEIQKRAKRGSWIYYNDGRPGHANVKARILSTDATGMTVKFEDRARSTRINFNDAAWINHIAIV